MHVSRSSRGRLLFGSCLVALAALTAAPPGWGKQPRKPDPDPRAPARLVGRGELPIGKWRVEFTNGVVQTCEIRQDGTARVVEPLRTSAGKAAVEGGATVVTYEDDRLERWTVVGRRLVVEHWFPATRIPATPAVLGIAERE